MRNKRIIAVVAIAVLVIAALLAGLRTNSSNNFRVIRAIPSGTLPTSSDTIVVEFNRELKGIEEQPVAVVAFNTMTDADILIQGKTLTISLLEELTVNQAVTVSINGLLAQDGSILNDTLEYFVEFVAYNKLSEEVRDLQDSQEGRSKDRHPLLTKLPYDEIAFRIEYEASDDALVVPEDWRGGKDDFTVIISTFTAIEGVEQEKVVEQTNTLRQRALDWIREQGVDPENDINIVYIPDDSVIFNTTIDATDDPDFFDAPEGLEERAL